MNPENIVEKCQDNSCDSWLCIFSSYSQTTTFFAALIGFFLCILIIFRFWKAEIADIGPGVTGMLAMAVILLSLPSVRRVTLSFAAQGAVLIELNSNSNANNVCTMQNFIAVSNIPLIKRISELENQLSQPNNSQSKDKFSQLSNFDVRIYYRNGKSNSADKLLSTLRTRFPVISTYNTDLTEVGQDRNPGFARVRYESVSNSDLEKDAAWIKDETIKILGSEVAGPDPVKGPLPGDIQILLY